MNILWIYPEIPFPLTSGYLRGFHLLRCLGRNHAIRFVCFNSEPRAYESRIQAIQAFAEAVEVFHIDPRGLPAWASGLSRVPVIGSRLLHFLAVKSAMKKMRAHVLSVIARQKFDVVLFHGREAIGVLNGVKIPVVVDCGDTNCSRILQQIRFETEASRCALVIAYIRMRITEHRIARRTPFRCFISERDRENLLGPFDRSEIVPQGVDSSYWSRTVPYQENKCIVFSGVMNYQPNVDAAVFLLDQIVPLVQREVPGLQVFIVGRDPAPPILEAGRKHPGTTVTGRVDDVRPFLEQASVFIAPLRFASGVQNKVLEAMSMGVPVVTTPTVAAGLHVDDCAAPVVVGETALELAAEVKRLLHSPDECRRHSAEGRRFIENHCSWDASAQKLERLCEAAVAHARSRCVPHPESILDHNRSLRRL